MTGFDPFLFCCLLITCRRTHREHPSEHLRSWSWLPCVGSAVR